MAATPPPVAAASCWGGCSGDVSVPVPAAAAPAADANPEKQLSLYVLCVAFGEWAGNAFGALAFVWATGVILGGFCSNLNRQDFWFAAVMIFFEALRIFSRSYKLDSQSLFGTTRALTWINSSFARMLGRPQEGDELVLIMGFWLDLIGGFSPEWTKFILDMALLIPWSRRPPRRPRMWQKRAVAIAYLLVAAYEFIAEPIWIFRPQGGSTQVLRYLAVLKLPIIIEGVAVLLLNLRPLWIAKLTSSHYGRKLISLAKVALALWFANDVLPAITTLASYYTLPLPLQLIFEHFGTPVTLLVLSLGSLQIHTSHSLFGRWIDTIIHIFFLFHSVPLQFPLLILDIFIPGSISSLPTPAVILLPYIFLVVLLVIGNLQIPAAVVQILLSSLRLSKLQHDRHMGYDSLPSDNMVAAIGVFYVLALCQGSLYIMASILGLFSLFPRRWLMRRSKLGGKLGAEAIDLYYERAYATRMEVGLFGTAAGSTISFDNFAIESLNSSSRDLQVAGLCVIHNILLKRTDCRTEDLILRVTRCSTAVSTLVSMLVWAADVEKDGCDIRLLAARVIAELAGSLRISSGPGMLKTVSSLLPADPVVLEVPNQQQRPGPQQTTLVASAHGGSVQSTQGSNGGWSCSWFCGLWQWMKPECCSVLEEPNLSHQDSLPVLGMEILEKLAHDLDNCAEIFKDDRTNLISKTIGIIGYASTSDNKQNDDLVCSSLKLLRRLASTGERIGAELQQVLWNHPFLLTSLAHFLEDDHSSRPHQVWEPAMDIIAKLTLDKEAGLEIGRNQVITARLRHNMYLYDQSVRKVSGEALANLALWGTVNCSAILEELGYEVINDLTNMLSDDDYIYLAARLLLNLRAHSSVNLVSSHPQASEHLSAALSTVSLSVSST